MSAGVMEPTNRRSKPRRPQWAVEHDRKLSRRRKQAYTSPIEPATPEDQEQHRSATAQPNLVPTAQERRDQFVERFIYPWAYAVCLRIASIRDRRNFADSVDMLTAHGECGPYYEDAITQLASEDEMELPDDPREEYRIALSEYGRARHLRKIARLTGTYPADTGDMTTGDVYSWFLELHDAHAKYLEAIAQ